MTEPGLVEWTLGELVERASSALAAADVRAPNGRVTPLPDGRVVRWYSTIGLVDRPVAMRGRTALYGQRHLYQLVAVKRRQAQGRTLAEIQAELTGATDAALGRIADIPPTSAHRPIADHSSADRAIADHASTDRANRAYPDGPGPEPATATAAAMRERFWTQAPKVNQDGVLSGVRLAGGAVLLLPGTPDGTELAEIELAAGPLLRLLAERGLLSSADVDHNGLPTGRGVRRDDDDR